MQARPDPFFVLQAYLEARGTFTDSDFAYLRTKFVPRSLAAGEFLQQAGVPSKYAAFVSSGCLKRYVINPDGKTHIIQFAPENWWVADSTSLSTGAPSQYFVDAIEDTEVLLLSALAQDEIVENLPEYAGAYRRGLQAHSAAQDKRIVRSVGATAEERYLDFLQTYSSVATRVPQWMLASYLGVSPETISRIRRKLSAKK